MGGGADLLDPIAADHDGLAGCLTTAIPGHRYVRGPLYGKVGSDADEHRNPATLWYDLVDIQGLYSLRHEVLGAP
jgi:hypothetical protein